MIRKLSLQNFKGVNASYDFRAANVALGRNYSGKTAIRQGIQSSVLGYVIADGITKTSSALKAYASDYPMHIGMTCDGAPESSIRFEKAKSKVQQTDDTYFAQQPNFTEQTRVLFDPSIFFGLTDAARISKACELVLSVGGSKEEISDEVATTLEIPQTEEGKDFDATKPLPAHVGVYARWLKAVMADATISINEFLAQSETFWKNEKKTAAAERERMQKGAEMVTDATAKESEVANLPARHEVETTKAETYSKIQSLSVLISKAEALATAISQRRARLEVLATSTASMEIRVTAAEKDALAVKQLEAGIAKLQGELETATAAFTKAGDEAKNAKLRAVWIAEAKGKVDKLESRRQAVTAAEQRLSTARIDYKAAVERVASAKRACEAAIAAIDAREAAIAEANKVRTDDFEKGASVDKEYTATVRLTLKPGEYEPVVVMGAIESWREAVAKDEELAMEERQEDAQLRQDSIDALAEHQAATDAQASIKEAGTAAAHALEVAKAELADSESAVGRLAEMKEQGDLTPPTAEAVAKLGTDRAAVLGNLNAAKAGLAGAKEAATKSATELEQCKFNLVEMRRLESEPLGGEPVSDAELAAYRTSHKVNTDTYNRSLATLEQITRFEQDQRRVREAAAAREKVEVTVKVYGKVIDLLAQKKQEIVSGSIDAPLAIANKLADGILKGRLAFEEGELGMRVGDKFVSSRVFSGIEAGLAMMGLTAGLASRSALRVLMLDEVATVGPEHIGTLMDNLLKLIADGDIDQFFLIGTQYREIGEAAEARPEINLIRV